MENPNDTIEAPALDCYEPAPSWAGGMTVEQQAMAWRYGVPLHDYTNGQCCPDFSCCGGQLAPEATRARFIEADRSGDGAAKWEMLSMFLGAMLSDKKVYIAGGSEGGTA